MDVEYSIDVLNNKLKKRKKGTRLGLVSTRTKLLGRWVFPSPDSTPPAPPSVSISAVPASSLYKRAADDTSAAQAPMADGDGQPRSTGAPGGAATGSPRSGASLFRYLVALQLLMKLLSFAFNTWCMGAVEGFSVTHMPFFSLIDSEICCCIWFREAWLGYAGVVYQSILATSGFTYWACRGGTLSNCIRVICSLVYINKIR
ncbi:hypothetical protein C2845_PM01G42880 [Panicum miliaceum]|uniref:Uncharacterized protein n=1 Tax=Panicum miliaceum TaxID=4540 RepID=A0A3L6TI32_PANMI|nr:hypothetical protein C2845_PM01G42880 [Panicum miliaceum]